MSQSTLGDDDLFSEAAEEMREEVTTHLDAARAELPESEAVWETDSDNVLGALNGLKSALEVGEAREHLRSAKKQFVVGKRADAFEDADDLEADIEELEELVGLIEAAAEAVGDLTNTVPQLRSALQDADDDG
jgi:hypothetical protein